MIRSLLSAPRILRRAFAAVCTVAALGAGLSSGDATAQELRPASARPIRLTASIGLTTGGDRLATAYYAYWDDYSVRAGNLVQGNFGIEFDLAPSLTMALTVGFHHDGADADNGDLTFRRWPIEALIHAQVAPNIRLGGGLRFPLNPRLRVSAGRVETREEFDTPIGVIAEGEYRFNPAFGLKLRGVTERYKSKQGLPTAKGDHIGLFAAFYF